MQYFWPNWGSLLIFWTYWVHWSCQFSQILPKNCINLTSNVKVVKDTFWFQNLANNWCNFSNWHVTQCFWAWISFTPYLIVGLIELEGPIERKLDAAPSGLGGVWVVKSISKLLMTHRLGMLPMMRGSRIRLSVIVGPSGGVEIWRRNLHGDRQRNQKFHIRFRSTGGFIGWIVTTVVII